MFGGLLVRTVGTPLFAIPFLSLAWEARCNPAVRGRASR